MILFEIGKVYQFNTKAPSILGSIIKNAKLLSILDYDTAILFDTIDIKYRQIYPLLPLGTIDSPKSSIYYRFMSESGEPFILADQWVDEASIEVVDYISFTVTFTNASIQDISRVRNAVNALGYLNYEIKQL